ncbi:MAG: hypothetical protein KGP29_01815 [Proteobacteria bacterium]|nr:hypothetical protein [Pseudomonadota bacterium]
MSKILNFLSIPLVRIIGIFVILYFALFSEKQNPNSLGNRLSKEEVKKNINEARERTRFIISNVKTAQELEVKPKAIQQNTEAKIIINDLEIGKGDVKISCGSKVEISYGIYVEGNKQIKAVSSEKLVIGNNLNEVIEKNILDMKIGGIRNIIIPRNFKTDNPKINELLKFYDSELRYQVVIISSEPPEISSQNSCQ